MFTSTIQNLSRLQISKQYKISHRSNNESTPESQALSSPSNILRLMLM